MATAAKFSRAQLFPLFAGLLLAASPHLQRLPWWVNAWIAALFAWRIVIALRAQRLPHRLWLIALAVGGIAGVLITYRTIFGRDAGVTLLVLLMSLKLLEMRNVRDVFVMVFLAYFLALTNFFYSQTIPTAGLMLATVTVITASLVGFNDAQGSVKSHFRMAGVLLLQASPVMLLLFFLFPRVPGPLWGLRTPSPASPASRTPCRRACSPACRSPTPSPSARASTGRCRRGARSTGAGRCCGPSTAAPGA
jgi:hypothetical protein